MHKDHRERIAALRAGGWKRIHHSPFFWVGVLLFLIAAAIYVLSDNLSLRLRG